MSDKNTETLIATSQEVARNFLAEPVGNISAQERLLAERIDALASALLTARERERTLREAIERDAAYAAYKADLGASEWRAFVGQWTWAALVASSGGQTPPSGETS